MIRMTSPIKSDKKQPHKKGRPAKNKKRGSRLKQGAFLAAYRTCGNITRAAIIAKIDRSSHFRWIKENSKYKTIFGDAHEAAADSLEEEARRRASEGWLEPVWYEGSQCGQVRKFSDTLLIFLLKGLRPEKYRERISAELSGSVQVSVRLEDARVRAEKAAKE